MKAKNLLAVASFALVMNSAHAMPLRGQINKDQSHGAVSFDIRLGEGYPNYTVSGATTALPQLSLIRDITLDFSPVEVKKNDFIGGMPQSMAFPNSGTIRVTPVARRASGLILAGIRIEGGFAQDYIDNNLDFDGLVVNRAYSRGILNYHPFTGTYVPEGSVRFGAYDISTHNHSSVIDHDNYAGQDLMKVDLGFGNLLLTGHIQFSNNGTTATTGSVNLNVVHRDGSDVTVSRLQSDESSDEQDLRALLAFLELTMHDLAAE